MQTHPRLVSIVGVSLASAVTTVGTASGVTRPFNSGVLFQGIAGSDGLPGDKGELVSVSTSPSLPSTPGKGPAASGPAGGGSAHRPRQGETSRGADAGPARPLPRPKGGWRGLCWPVGLAVGFSPPAQRRGHLGLSV